MILLSESDLPDEKDVPEGFRYYMYHVEKDGDETYGCFIGQDPSDIYEIPDIIKFAGAHAEVCLISREDFVEFHDTLKIANTKQDIESVTDDSPAA